MVKKKFLVVVMKGSSFSREWLKETIKSNRVIGKFSSQIVLAKGDIPVELGENGNIKPEYLDTISNRLKNEGCSGLFLANLSSQLQDIKKVFKTKIVAAVDYPKRLSGEKMKNSVLIVHPHKFFLHPEILESIATEENKVVKSFLLISLDDSPTRNGFKNDHGKSIEKIIRNCKVSVIYFVEIPNVMLVKLLTMFPKITKAKVSLKRYDTGTKGIININE